MARDSQGILVLFESAYPTGKPGDCKYCGASMRWFTKAERGGKKLPFNQNPRVLNVFTDPDTHVKTLRLAAEDLHGRTCPNRPAPPPRVQQPGLW